MNSKPNCVIQGRSAPVSIHSKVTYMRAAGGAVLQVWSTHVLKFEEHPTDGLMVVHQEELQDQFTLLGSMHVGLSSVRTDPGTPLNWIRDAVRGAVGAAIAVGTPVLVQVLEAVGWIKQE
jgi:hypothetical protein